MRKEDSGHLFSSSIFLFQAGSQVLFHMYFHCQTTSYPVFLTLVHFVMIANLLCQQLRRSHSSSTHVS
ncbi:hypothetical protein Hanom_Chr05g00444021 [Helianthus anomalus]